MEAGAEEDTKYPSGGNLLEVTQPGKICGNDVAIVYPIVISTYAQTVKLDLRPLDLTLARLARLARLLDFCRTLFSIRERMSTLYFWALPMDR